MTKSRSEERIAALETALLELLARVQELEARSDPAMRALYRKAENELRTDALRKMTA